MNPKSPPTTRSTTKPPHGWGTCIHLKTTTPILNPPNPNKISFANAVIATIVFYICCHHVPLVQESCTRSWLSCSISTMKVLYFNQSCCMLFEFVLKKSDMKQNLQHNGYLHIRQVGWSLEQWFYKSRGRARFFYFFFGGASLVLVQPFVN